MMVGWAILTQKRTKEWIGCIFGPHLDAERGVQAMRQRQTYATTGHRPIMHVWMEDTEQQINQGYEYLAQDPTFAWRFHGTNGLRSVTVWTVVMDQNSGQQALEEYTPTNVTLDHSGTISMAWDGVTPMAVWLEVVQEDLEKAWSSPIWITADCDRLEADALDPFGLCETVIGDTGGDDGFGCEYDSASWNRACRSLWL